MMGELWWTRLVNSVRFLDDAASMLKDGHAVQLVFETQIPWRDILINTLAQRLTDRTTDVLSVAQVDKPGDFLLKEYCSKSEQNNYWPTTYGCPERFLAQLQETWLNGRYVVLTGITPSLVTKWTASISEYLEACDETRPHGIFIMLVEGATTTPTRKLRRLNYTDYISDYDCMMLCLTLISSLSCSRSEKMYLCEVANNIAGDQIEIAGALASKGLDLIRDPLHTANRTYTEYGLSTAGLSQQVRTALWEAQIKLLFPKIENFRAAFIQKHEAQLQRYLPIKSSNNDQITTAQDLEIGQLFYICKENSLYKIADQAEYDCLKQMREARNALAHWTPLSYEMLQEMGIF